MKVRILTLVAVLIAAFAASASAQVGVTVTAPNVPGGERVVWDPPGSTYGPLYVSPYTGALTIGGTTQSVVLNCVDFFHSVTLNSPYLANQTYLNAGSLAGTRFNNATWYLQAAWLTQQYSWPDPSDAPSRQIAIQAAIWNIMTSGAPDQLTGDAGSVNDQRYWITMAQNNWQTVDASRFYLLSAVNNGAQQEFLVYNPSAVPEPATLTLLGTGMAGLAAAARRRRRKQAEAVA